MAYPRQYPAGAECSVDGCRNLRRKREWCDKHYRQWRKTGSPVAYRRAAAAAARAAAQCAADGCDNTPICRGCCDKHYRALLKYGDPLARKRAPAGSGFLLGGYRYVSARANRHPLQTKNEKVSAHRVVLYDAIGSGEHPCTWCGKVVSWEKSWPRDRDALVVDHLDGDRLNNELENLVPSCQPCNSKRANDGRRAAVPL